MCGPCHAAEQDAAGRAMKDKTNCLTTSCEFYEYCGTIDAPIYQVRGGMITVK